MGCIFLSGVPLMVSNVDAICPNPLCTANDLDGDGLTNRDESFKYPVRTLKILIQMVIALMMVLKCAHMDQIPSI